MTGPISPLSAGVPSSALMNLTSGATLSEKQESVGQRFEQMLWAEMLSHAGLEDALTLGGGEAASAFSRYVVEAIAADLAEQQSLGLTDSINTEMAETTGADQGREE